MIDERCELSARVTPGDSKCQLYRKSYEPSCRVCLAIIDEGKRVDMSKRGDCVVCGKQDISLPVAGKCSVCYEKYRKATGKASPQVVSTPAPVKREDVQKRVKAAMAKPKPVAVQEREALCPDPVKVALQPVADHVEIIDTDCPDCGSSPCECVVAVPSAPDITRHDHVAYLRELAHVMVESMVSELNTAADPEQYARMYLVACDRLRGRR